MGKHKGDSANDLVLELDEIYVCILFLLMETLFKPVGIAVDGMVVETTVTFSPAD